MAQSDGSESLSAYRGLAQRSPVLALSMLLFLLSLGGAILTVVALFYYLLVAKRMYIATCPTRGVR